MTSDYLETERERVQAKKAAGGGSSPQKEQGAIANSALQRLLADEARLHRKGVDPAGSTVDEQVADRIEARRGRGQGLDAAARAKLEGAFDHDFSDVRVHADGEADKLNREVNAEAFTTGRDIFFRAGAYNPGSAAGQRLLAHELTHVVQQRGASQADGMRVSDPSDSSEREADAVADDVLATSSGAARGVSRQPEDEELQTSVARQPEDEELQMSVAREPEDEEELQTSVARQPEDEEELQTSVARQSAIEDEDEPRAE